MGRFFGPTPNIISGEGFFRGSAGASGPLEWTSRGQPIPADGQFVTYGNGVLIASAGQTLWRSTDDGHTWTEVLSTVRAYGEITYAGGGVWGAVLQVSSGQGVVRSTNDGLTWGAPIVFPTPAPQAPSGLASNGAGTWVAGGGFGSGTTTHQVMRSTDNGLTWAPVAQSLGTFFRIIWDGSQFVASCRTTASSGANAGVATSPDGSVWTQTQISAVNNYIFGLSFDSVSGLYIVVTNDQDTLRVAATPAGLGTAADTPDGQTDGGAQTGIIGNGSIWVFGGQGSASRSTDGGSTFDLADLNYSPAGDVADACAYDPVNNVFVAVGDDGNVSTFP